MRVESPDTPADAGRRVSRYSSALLIQMSPRSSICTALMSSKRASALNSVTTLRVRSHAGHRISIRGRNALYPADPDVGVPCQISQSVASRSGPFTFPCQPSGPKRLGCPFCVSDQPGGHGTLHQQARRHEHPSEASPRASNDRAESTGNKPPQSPSWADLDHNLHLDRLPLNQARPGQSHLGGPTYLARDSSPRPGPQGLLAATPGSSPRPGCRVIAAAAAPGLPW